MAPPRTVHLFSYKLGFVSETKGSNTKNDLKTFCGKNSISNNRLDNKYIRD